MSSDDTERKQAETESRKSEEWFRHLIQNSPDIITVVDADGTILYHSPSMEKILGHKPEERIGKNAVESDLIHPEDRATKRNMFTKAIRGPGTSVTGEVRMRHRDGSWRYMHETIRSLLDDPNVGGVVFNNHDITERKQAEEQLKHQAFHDSLTELPNRVLLLDRLEHALSRFHREGGSVALLLVDLDDFKLINDSLGHAAGDTLLVEVAKRLRSCVRPGDTVARFFGDEFVILLEAPTSLDEARRAAKRIQERLQESFEIARREVFVRCSIGIALGESAEDQPEEILRHADLAMYAAKGSGKDQFAVYSPSMDAWAQDRVDLESDLNKAIERDEFEVHYQPMIELSTGEISGFEALVRWKHPERGLVAASEFIELAEETGLIRFIGRWVIEEACRQARLWQERYPDRTLLMNVNLSVSQFSDQSELVPQILDEIGLDPRSLQLEITERAMMHDVEVSLSKLRNLKGLGISFAIDDFGMGYSCLYYLKRMPVDSLKIDQTFIAGLGEDPGDEAIVSGVISLGHALGLKVVAEGVETEEQLARLREMGCDLAQGYHFAKPLPSEDAEKLLVEGISW
jgi:diguanylate cyclase (GGDEF)-like protein/PAS domain S-box-containing protein